MATRSDLHCLLDASSELPSEYTRHFANYLQKNHQAEIEAILMELDAASSAHYSVSVNVLDLLQENLALGTLLLHHPQDLLERFDAALVVAQEQVMSNHDDVHFMAVKESAHARPHHLPRCRELWKETVSSIRAASINTLLSVSGTVIRTGQIKMLQSRREYRCVKCEHRFTLTADLEQRHQMPIPDECPSHNAKPCKRNRGVGALEAATAGRQPWMTPLPSRTRRLGASPARARDTWGRSCSTNRPVPVGREKSGIRYFRSL